MSMNGQRKAALFLATLPVPDRRALLARLPERVARDMRPLIDGLVRRGWTARAAVDVVLAEDLRGLTAETTLDVEQLMALSRRLPADWYARVLVSAGPVDHDFMLALLDDAYARRVRDALAGLRPLPPLLAAATLAEATRLAAGGEGACAA